MRRIAFIAAPLAMMALAACATTPADNTLPPSAYAAAVADASRPDSDRQRDALRLPAQVLSFAEVAPGEVVGDYLMGAGYFTRLLSAAVGSRGKVYGFQADEFVGFRPAYATEQDTVVDALANVFKVRSPIGAPAFPEPLDTLITVQNFHDLYIGPMPAGTGAKGVKAFYDALKPGGTLVVIDHSAAPGTGSSAADGLHRIDRQFVIDTLTAAGFRLDGSADFYARPDDPRTANVFDPSIRGKTDQFVLRFRKPG